ncbi:MAG: histidinol-phosphatase HisJ family protein [Bacillota bacterium]|nr:histidinol-phosphatase HisJ family protein [Bacillota bacterium]
MKITADCHVHSNTSPDAKDSIDAMCQAAIAKGLRYICFTNHHEIFPGDPTPRDFILNFQAYDEEIAAARDKYSHKLKILQGVEFGCPHRHPKEYEELLKKDLDMIIASLHFMPVNFAVHYLWSSTECMLAEAGKYFTQRYFEEMEALSAVAGFQVLAHMDWPKHALPQFEEIEALKPIIFENLLKNKAVLEINTKALVNGCREFYPAYRFLEQYKALGGKRLTVGSDAHNTEELAGFFPQVEDYLSENPFEIGYFEKKKFIQLDN